MAKFFSLPVFTVQLAFRENVNLVYPLLIPDAVTVNDGLLASYLISRLKES